MRDLAHHRYTRADYLAIERNSPIKHEYFDGEIFAMAGGTPQHALLAANVLAELGGQLRGKPCKAYTSDLRIYVEKTGLETYPDVSVICGPPRLDVVDKNAVVNPTVVVEVLSPSTEDYDRGKKFENFRQIESLQHYVLVSYREALVEVFTRTESGPWSRVEARKGATAALPAIDCKLSVDVTYEGVELA